MQTNIHIFVLMLSMLLLFLIAGIRRYHIHRTRITALRGELVALTEDIARFNRNTHSPLLSPDTTQKFQTAGKHIEQLQKAAACEGTRSWTDEDYELAAKRQRVLPLCEWLTGWGQTIDIINTYEELRVCRLEAGDAVMTADGNIVRGQALNDGYWGDKERPIGDDQALLHMELDVCQEILESREEFVRDTGDFGEGKFLRSSVVGEWRVR